MAEKKSLIQRRGRAKAALTRLKTFAELISDSTVVEDIAVRLDTLEETWKEFRAIEDDLLLIDEEESEIEENEKKYFDVKSLMLRSLNSRQPRAKQEPSDMNSTMNQFISQQQSLSNNFDRSQNSLNTVRLPKLNIPEFSGDYKEWNSFKDLFEASINGNGSLSGSQKFQYLKGLVKGSPASLIRHLPVTDSSFSEAWEKLKKRFDKPSHIVTSFIRTFMELSNLSSPSFRALRTLCDVCDEVTRGLKSLGTSAEARDPWLIYILLTKIDSETRESWSHEVAGKEFPTFDEFLAFLSKRCDALETAGTVTKKIPHIVKTLHNSVNNKNFKCVKCAADHPVYQCSEFKAGSPDNRKAFVISKSLCFRCLGLHHSVKNCFSKVRCYRCKGNHHSLLHEASSRAPRTNASDNSSLSKQSIASINSQQSTRYPDSSIKPNAASCHEDPQLSALNTYTSKPREVFSTVAILPTALCNVMDISGQNQSCRVLLDSGSQISLISEQFAQRLGLKRHNARLAISGLSSVGVGHTNGKLYLNIFPHWENSYGLQVVAYIMDNLTSYVPSKTVCTDRCNFSRTLKLANPDFHKSSTVDIILGADKFFEVLCEGKLHNSQGHPIAHNTIFGWVMAGTLSAEHSSALSMSISSLTDLNKTLQSFWRTDNMGLESPTLSGEDMQAETHFRKTSSRAADGRYIVSLPFKEDVKLLGHSKRNALIRLQSIERRFAKDVNYKNAYTAFMREYEQLDHMEQIPESEITIDDNLCFFFPHHAVFKNEPNPKIRVVFDGSCKTSSGISLNDNLVVGPTIQRDLASILISFRKNKIALSADVQKMYRQVLIAPSDRDYQRIVWRDDPSLPIKQYRLKTVTYGTSAASFLATRVLHQIGEDHKKTFPGVCSVIQRDFYVDDLLSGADSLSDAIALQSQLTKILKSSGFPLTKWCSNAADVRKEIRNDSSRTDILKINDNSDTTKILGIQWNPETDMFSFHLKLSTSHADTKRKILSESSRIFDPLGWLAPIVILIKILFQKLWVLKYEWDEVLPAEIRKKWGDLQVNLSSISEIRIPRRIYPEKLGIELHGFSDASELAYGAVIYCRSQSNEGQISIRIVAAKTKVAPLRQVSLPRLELCAALLLTRLMKMVSNALLLENVSMFAWTDSSIVLAWLSDIPRRWNTFVANRTSEILEQLPRVQWKHVSSKDNPADSASRGVRPSDLTHLSLWWNGPPWLSKDKVEWPSNSPVEAEDCARQEERKRSILSHLLETRNDTLTELSTRYSSFYKFVRIVGYLLRFCDNSRKLKEIRSLSPILSTKEVNQSIIVCIKWMQEGSFIKEIKNLKLNRSIVAGSPLSKLNCFLDTNGIMRVGGRLQNSEYSFNVKHPVILPKAHNVTTLLVRDTHHLYLHSGPSLLINILRQRFWIPSIRNIARKVCRECFTCVRHKASTTTQLMGDLPKPRVTISRPFAQVGTDYAGPIILSTRIGRGSKTMKGYIALFVCFTTKALHLELVSSLTSDAFVAALRRFISRRGIPKDIYCDNGTNFVGGKKHINELHKLALSASKDPLIAFFLSQQGITWHFIPPSAPNFGGLWEAAVRSVKFHLRRVIGETILGFEEMTTLLSQIEAILNSRPISALSSDPEDYNALTPGHFIIGEALTTLPESDIVESKVSRLDRWRHIQAMMQGFWKRWRLDYLTSLQERQKWTKTHNSLTEGDLVVIREDNMPATKWLLGRIVQVHPGRDELVRVVSIKTQRGIYKRAINRIIRLPLVESSSS